MNIHEIKLWFDAAVPNPTNKNRAVQLGCHFEEVAEMLEAVRIRSSASVIHDLATHLKKDAIRLALDIDRKELLDSLCDQIVTAVGVAHMFGFDIVHALSEVNRSNWSKFVDGMPVFDANGKIAKSDGYSPPDLEGMY